MQDDKGNIVDYARSLIVGEQLIRKVGDLCLHRQYSEAQPVLVELITELRVLQHTLLLMQEADEKQNHPTKASK